MAWAFRLQFHSNRRVAFIGIHYKEALDRMVPGKPSSHGRPAQSSHVYKLCECRPDYSGLSPLAPERELIAASRICYPE